MIVHKIPFNWLSAISSENEKKIINKMKRIETSEKRMIFSYCSFTSAVFLSLALLNDAQSDQRARHTHTDTCIKPENETIEM